MTRPVAATHRALVVELPWCSGSPSLASTSATPTQLHQMPRTDCCADWHRRWFVGKRRLLSSTSSCRSPRAGAFHHGRLWVTLGGARLHVAPGDRRACLAATRPLPTGALSCHRLLPSDKHLFDHHHTQRMQQVRGFIGLVTGFFQFREQDWPVCEGASPAAGVSGWAEGADGGEIVHSELAMSGLIRSF